jgi:LmbE family N-acetylglucosaminyl deacetylase
MELIFLKKNMQKQGQYILFAGRIEINQKGLDLLLKAYCQVKEEVGLPLYIAGAGTAKEENKLRVLIDDLKLKDSVVLLGKVGERAKAELFEKAALCVVPSRFETFSLTALESLAFGVPVVAFNIPGLSWLPQAVALKTPLFNEAVFAEGMLKLVKDENLRQGMGRQGRELAGRYSWESAAEKYKVFFKAKLLQNTAANAASSEALGNTRIIDRIIEQKLPCYFISPHLDDAALSAGDLITHLSGKTELTIVTVFTKASPKPYSLSVRRFLKLHGYSDAEKMYEDRRAEDKEVWQQLKAKAMHLGFVDGLWRKKNRQNIAVRLLGKIVAELNYLYPTYRLHVMSGRLKKEDLKLGRDIAEALSQVVPSNKECAIFCAAGLGGHVDHVLVRTACEEAFKNVILWKDATYQLKAGDKEVFESRKAVVWRSNTLKKNALLSLYKSQIPVMFAAGKRPEIYETYYINPNVKTPISNQI